MVNAIKGLFISCDIPMAQFIINMNNSLPSSQKFIIHILDNTHLFVQPHMADMIRSAISEFREQNSVTTTQGHKPYSYNLQNPQCQKFADTSALFGSFKLIIFQISSTSCMLLRNHEGKLNLLSALFGGPCSKGLASNAGAASFHHTSSALLRTEKTPFDGDAFGIHRSGHESNEEYPFLESEEFKHRIVDWQEKRLHKLTASTFAGAVGFFPRRRVRLWKEKVGAIRPFSGNLATRWSNLRNEEACETYKLLTNNHLSFPECQVYGKQNPEDDWIAASHDIIIDGFSSKGVLVIKCPFVSGDPWKRIPLHCIPQAQGLMEILDYDWMDFYVWTMHGSSLFRIYRDEQYWDMLRMALSDFWWNHVQPAREFYQTNKVSHGLIELEPWKPQPRHESWSTIVNETRRIVNDSELLIREIHGKLKFY